MTLVWKSGWNGLTESEAIDYVAAVEAADGQELEFGVAKAINDFVLGCKQDGIWDAIKASCILAGARTLAGALVPLVGTAPTNFNFVSGDYNRETGLKGNGTKNLLSNYTLLASNSTNTHLSVFPTEALAANSEFAGGMASTNLANGLTGIYIDTNTSAVYYACWNINNYLGPVPSLNKIVGVSRSSSASFVARGGGVSSTISQAAVASPVNTGVRIFTRDIGGVAQTYGTPARLSFYSIGESLDLALLDTRVSNLITAIGAAIP
jgi:hypothetical protein